MPEEPRPRRVVIVTSSYPRHEEDPAGHFVRAEAIERAQRGEQVTVVCPGSGRSTRDGEVVVVGIPDGGLFGWPGALYRLRERPARVIGLVRFVVGARQWLRQAGPVDLVVAHWVVPAGWPIALAANGPVEVVAHGSDVALLARAPHVARAVVGRLLSRGARLRFVSERLRAELCAVVGPQLAAASCVGAAPLVLPTTPTREAARAELGVEQGRPLLLVVSRLVPGKRVATALRAASLVPHARVVVLGDGPLRAPLAARFPGVELPGLVPRSRVLTWMAAADALLSASRHEGAPTVVREARALGLPVIAAPAGDLEVWSATDPGLAVISAPAADTTAELD